MVSTGKSRIQRRLFLESMASFVRFSHKVFDFSNLCLPLTFNSSYEHHCINPSYFRQSLAQYIDIRTCLIQQSGQIHKQVQRYEEIIYTFSVNQDALDNNPYNNNKHFVRNCFFRLTLFVYL